MVLHCNLYPLYPLHQGFLLQLLTMESQYLHLLVQLVYLDQMLCYQLKRLLKVVVISEKLKPPFINLQLNLFNYLVTSKMARPRDEWYRVIEKQS